jgi:hypothetical protein
LSKASEICAKPIFSGVGGVLMTIVFSLSLTLLRAFFWDVFLVVLVSFSGLVVVECADGTVALF